MADRVLIAILAAGASRRLGQAKQLVTLDQETLLHRQSRIALESDLGVVSVILGCLASQCTDSICDLDVSIHINDSWTEGLAASMRIAAQAAIDAQVDGLLLFHVDQFRVTPNDLKRLYSEWSRTGCVCACRAVHENYSGPPVILPASCFTEMMELRGDVGGRRIFESFAPSLLIEVPIASAPHDLDLPDQLIQLL